MNTHNPGLGIRLPKLQMWIAYITFFIVALSGIIWIFFATPMDPTLQNFAHSLQNIHGVAAGMTLIVLGSFLPVHVRLALRRQRNRISGLATLMVFMLLGITGWLLYYSGEGLRDSSRIAHIAIGVLATLIVPLHIWLGRARPKKVPSR